MSSPTKDRRNDQDVDDIQPGEDVVGRVFATEYEERQPGADHRNGEEHGVHDPDPGTREQVVGQRVAGETVADR